MNRCVVNSLLVLILSLFVAACHSLSHATLKPKTAEKPVAEALNKEAKDLKSKPKKVTPTNPKESEDLITIKEIFKKYRLAKSVKMKVKKSVHMDLLDQDKESSGMLYYSKGKIRLEIKKPHESLLIMNQKIIWMVNQLPEEFGGELQVTKITSKATSQKSKATLALLLSDEKVWKNFFVKKSEKTKNKSTFWLSPVESSELIDVKKVHLKLDTKNKKIEEIGYWDDIGNITRFKFSSIKFNTKMKKEIFNYVPPKNAEVTEY